MAEGRKEVTEAVLGAVSLANAAVGMAADGKVGLDDLSHLMAALPKVIAAVEGADKIPAEVMDLDSAEGAALVADVATSLAIGDEKAKKVVLASLKTLLGVRDLIVALVEKPADPAPVV